ncbi:FAD-dependent oxidoreductase [Paenibacillus flagellatus]|uniref:FAD-dependent oxidoreductase n=1 Tax=Paenibacillus flagellatus TaxID=2211139 RepID=A0A2V5K3E9_9BACL|nr:FAD-dependent oxidoreductase [Paenibacillus flagellatus]PYI53769.1 FAD-dependent oxidoreductase [Paenibacillus flagellatus]
MKNKVWIGTAVVLAAAICWAGYRYIAGGKTDVVIVGTELEGMYLAKRAHELGLRVAVLEPEAAVGGQLLRGEMLYLDETFDDKGKSLLQGSIKELFRDYYAGQIRKLDDFTRYFQSLTRGIPIVTQAGLTGAKTENGSVRSLSYRTPDGREKTVEADYFVDNTDNASLVRLLGVERLPGLEALYQSPQPEYMSATYMMKFKGVDWETFYGSFWKMNKTERMTMYGPETYVDGNLAYGFPPIVARYEPQNPDKVNLRGLNILNQKDGEIIINALQVYDVDPNDPESVRRAMEYAREEMPHIRDHLRQHVTGFQNVELNGEPAYLYIREYNHYPTEHTLEASDLLGGEMFWDNVSVGGYFIDIQGSRSNREGFAIGRPDKYGIPLRSYLLKAADNVILTGKLVGATPVAYGSARIQPNGSLAAESIGVLLARLEGKNVGLKQVTPEIMTDFHAHMREKYGIELQPGQGTNKIEGMSPEDVADLNKGHITLLANKNQARTLPFIRVYFNNAEIKFTAHKPVIVDGKTWTPVEELLRAFGAQHIRLDLDRGEIRYARREEPDRMLTIAAPLHILNNRVLVNLREISDLFGYKTNWDNLNRIVTIYSDEPAAPASP